MFATRTLCGTSGRGPKWKSKKWAMWLEGIPRISVFDHHVDRIKFTENCPNGADSVSAAFFFLSHWLFPTDIQHFFLSRLIRQAFSVSFSHQNQKSSALAFVTKGQHLVSEHPRVDQHISKWLNFVQDVLWNYKGERWWISPKHYLVLKGGGDSGAILGVSTLLGDNHIMLSFVKISG